MKIAGIDASINGSAIAVLDIRDDDFEIRDERYHFFTRKKVDLKLARSGILGHHFPEYESKTIRNFHTTAAIRDILQSEDIKYSAIEDYAMGIRNGTVFDIGEFCGLVKHHLYLDGILFRVYDIPSIKIFASGNGAADKGVMLTAYKMKIHSGVDLAELQTAAKSPMSDMIDACWIARMLRVELMLRAGITTLKDLPDEQRRIFLRTTKGNPVNILDKGWNQ